MNETMRDRRILVFGLGESGYAMARWCVRQGAEVIVCDTRPAPPYLDRLRAELPKVSWISTPFDERFDKRLLAGIDRLALSPGLSPGLMAVLQARACGIEVVSELALFAEALIMFGERQRCRIVAITGTNGKTTTTALTGALGRAAGRHTAVAGNISPSLLSALMRHLDAGRLPELWALELSSFQLELPHALAADAATVLNLSADHLDRYIDLDEYAQAKAGIFSGDGAQVLNRQDERVRAMALPGRRIITFGSDAPADELDFGLRPNRGEAWIVQGDRFLLPCSQLGLHGQHNALNAMAALALLQALDIAPFGLMPALRAFTALPHRVETIAVIDGVRYIDDSKGTNVGATEAAIAGLGQPAVVILGGDGKGQDFSPLRDAIATHARAVVLIGRDGPRIAAALAGCGVPIETASDLPAAVRQAAAFAQPGDAVLLSPACASFDMFRDYQHRAEVFRAAVRALDEHRSAARERQQ